jgi:Copper binding proteins, plastocyanin/azurin family
MTGAAAASVLVSMLSGAFSPAHLDVMTGDNVAWTNTSTKTHNIKFETEGFDSGRVPPRTGANHVFPVAGVYPYVCTIHDGMTGVIGVYPLLLEGPTKRVRRGTSIAFHVRAPEHAGEVRIEADTGSGFQPVAVAGPGTGGGGHEGHEEPGMVHANLVASETAVYRAAFAGGSSNELRIEVTDAPDLAARVRRGRKGRAVVTASARPSTPGARVVLQLKLRERFGWWPVARARLDEHSQAHFKLRRDQRGVPARVVLVGPDWATVLSESRVLKLPRR